MRRGEFCFEDGRRPLSVVSTGTAGSQAGLHQRPFLLQDGGRRGQRHRRQVCTGTTATEDRDSSRPAHGKPATWKHLDLSVGSVHVAERSGTPSLRDVGQGVLAFIS